MSIETLIDDCIVPLQSGIEVVVLVWLLPAVLVNVAVVTVVDELLIGAIVRVLVTPSIAASV